MPCGGGGGGKGAGNFPGFFPCCRRKQQSYPFFYICGGSPEMARIEQSIIQCFYKTPLVLWRDVFVESPCAEDGFSSYLWPSRRCAWSPEFPLQGLLQMWHTKISSKVSLVESSTKSLQLPSIIFVMIEIVIMKGIYIVPFIHASLRSIYKQFLLLPPEPVLVPFSFCLVTILSSFFSGPTNRIHS